MDLTIGAIAKQIAQGLPMALAMFFVLVAGFKAMWLWPRELAALKQSNSEQLILKDQQLTLKDQHIALMQTIIRDKDMACSEWKDIAKRLMHVNEQIAPAIPKA